MDLHFYRNQPFSPWTLIHTMPGGTHCRGVIYLRGRCGRAPMEHDGYWSSLSHCVALMITTTITDVLHRQPDARALSSLRLHRSQCLRIITAPFSELRNLERVGS